MSNASHPQQARSSRRAQPVREALAVSGNDAWQPSVCWESRVQLVLKRTIDIFGGCVAFAMIFPILIIAGLLILLTSPGPVIFRQQRVGKDGKKFRIYKLRTMYVNNDNSAHHAYYTALVEGRAAPNGKTFKLVDDPRITRVGRTLRRLSIDELPQLINVIKGDMSLVGPRPPLEYEVALYDEEAKRRLGVKPGMTGLWQVRGRNALNFHQMVALDLEYISSWSVLIDVRILLLTPWVVIKAVGVG